MAAIERNQRNENRRKLRVAHEILKDVRSSAYVKALKGDKQTRKTFVSNILGPGRLGFRHSQFLGRRTTSVVSPVDGEVINGCIRYLTQRKSRPSDRNHSRDPQFRCGFFYGYKMWLMDAYAKYLDGISLAGTPVHIPDDLEMRTNFRPFWAAMLILFKLRLSDAPLPAWVI